METKTEGEQYWADRKPDDTRMDWRNDGVGWIDEYIKSKDHPHRDMILYALRNLEPLTSVFEIGCNAGPNLTRIHEAFPYLAVAGIDANEAAVLMAPLPTDVQLFVGSVQKLPVPDQSYDVVLSDAVLMYSDDIDIEIALDEVARVARKAVILVEWYAEGASVVKDYHWAHDFPVKMAARGFTETVMSTINEDIWPNETWQKNGRLFVCRRALPTGEPS